MLEKLLRDAQRIVKWRSFYLKTLHPLDVEAVKLIKENTHLYYQVSKTGVVCVFPIVVVPILPHADFGPNDHREDAPTLLRYYY